MPMETINRRKFLEYALYGIGIATAGIGYYFYTKNKREASVPIQTLTQQTETITYTPALNRLASYAKSKGLSDPVIERLGNKLGDRLTDNSKALIDYLYELSKAEVVSPQILQFAPKDYNSSVIQSLQLKAIDEVVVDSKVPDQTVAALGYLSNFSGYTQRWYIEQHGLYDSAIELLTKAKSLGNQDFARYAVESLVCIQDHNPLTAIEAGFLENPRNKFREVRDGYLADMESRGNPYDDFAKDWRKMLKRSGVDREIESLDATEDWVYLVLNSNNPEVKEAEELKLKGGTPSQSDFKYTVPNYNTEQLVQYWLGKQNEFRLNDTLAQAIAMVNGLWVTIGDEEVRQAVHKDTNDLLNFFRETNEIQKAKEYYQLEDYPLEAKVCFAYTSSIGTIDGPHSLWKFIEKHATQKDYRWVRYGVDALQKMREIALERGWVERSVDLTVKNLEEYFYFSGAAQHWKYSTRTGDVPGVTESLIEINGEQVPDHGIYNLRFYLELYQKTGRGIGDCGDETYLMEALCKSWGIATDFVLHQIIVDGKFYGHAHMIYYEPLTRTWKAYREQLADEIYWNKSDLSYYVFIFRPPVKQAGYLTFSPIVKSRMGISGTAYVTRYTPIEFRQIYQDGCPTLQMKRWLLYS
jgi:hypothetical protein